MPSNLPRCEFDSIIKFLLYSFNVSVLLRFVSELVDKHESCYYYCCYYFSIIIILF